MMMGGQTGSEQSRHVNKPILNIRQKEKNSIVKSNVKPIVSSW